MKPSRSFYRFVYWAIKGSVLIAMPVLIVRVIFGPESALEADLWRWATYGVAGVVTVGFIGYVLRYGREWAKGMMLSLISFVVCYGLLEGVCGLVLRWRQGVPTISTETGNARNKTQKSTELRLIHNDRLGTYRPAPGQYQTVYSVAPRAKSNANRPVAVTYTIDSLSRRITPSTSRWANRYALFLGCSFTYGEAVADTSTLPYFFEKATGFRSYNYGVSGQSPANMLALLQTVNLRKEVAERDGIAVYTFITDHLARATPSTFWAHNANGFLPHVDPKRGVVEGTYAQKHPVRMQLIHWMYRSNIVNLFKINFPKRYTTEHYQRFVGLVRKSKELYRNQFGNDNFYVVVFPEYPMDAELRQLFGQARVNVLDYARLLIWKTAPDGLHPDADAYRQVARKLAQDVVHKPNRPVAFAR